MGVNLRVIKGGLSGKKDKDMEFLQAHVTDTRLMGVLYLYVRWIDAEGEYLHMFFYLDAEETGFETYRSYSGNDTSTVLDIESEMSGGLGGRMIELTEREARALLLEYAAFNSSHGLPLPDGKEEYGFMLSSLSLGEREREELISKECIRIKSDYQLIHYFLMRCFGHDFQMARRLSTEDVNLRIYDGYEKASFYRNKISVEEDGRFICESLIESRNRYMIIVSEIRLYDGRVSYFANCSRLPVSDTEAAMILSRSEFINSYEILVGPDFFAELISEITHNAMLTSHENGEMYMLLNENNDHVDGPVFQMNDDVDSVYFVTKYGQLIASAYTGERIARMHGAIRNGRIGDYVVINGRYEFKDPVLYDFVQSDFDDFEVFVEYITGEDL